jgi:hypothetical protein
MVFKSQVLTMNLDDVFHDMMMQALLKGRGNPRTVFRTMMQVKRNEIFWKLMNERTNSTAS